MSFGKDIAKSSEAIDLTLHNNFLNNTENRDPVFYSSCEDASYGCLAFPAGCLDTLTCSLGVSWIGLSPTTYSLHLLSDSGKDYVAVGFPSTSAMGPAPALLCDSLNALHRVGVEVKEHFYFMLRSIGTQGTRAILPIMTLEWLYLPLFRPLLKELSPATLLSTLNSLFCQTPAVRRKFMI